jgi:hypothetical protein
MVTFTSKDLSILYDTKLGYMVKDGVDYRPMKAEYHMGSIHYRARGSSKRFSRNKLKKIMKKCQPFLLPQIECPF